MSLLDDPKNFYQHSLIAAGIFTPEIIIRSLNDSLIPAIKKEAGNTFQPFDLLKHPVFRMLLHQLFVLTHGSYSVDAETEVIPTIKTCRERAFGEEISCQK